MASMMLIFALQVLGCPEGYKCVPDEVAARMASDLEQYQCIMHGLKHGGITTKDNPLEIVIAKDGSVYTPGVFVTEVMWCDVHMTLGRELQGKVLQADNTPEEKLFRLRLRIGVSAEGDWDAMRKGPSLDWISPVLAAEVFSYGVGTLGVYSSLHSFGILAGLDLTNTVNFGAGIGVRYGSWGVTPMLGLTVALH